MTIKTIDLLFEGILYKNPQNHQNPQTSQYLQKIKKIDQGVHDHDVLVDLVHIPEGGKMQISSKLEQY